MGLQQCEQQLGSREVGSSGMLAAAAAAAAASAAARAAASVGLYHLRQQLFSHVLPTARAAEQRKYSVMPQARNTSKTYFRLYWLCPPGR